MVKKIEILIQVVLQSGTLYVIKLSFEMLNAIFFDMFDKNALIVNWAYILSI